MPRIAPSDHGGSATADRVLSLLAAFHPGDDELTLAQMAIAHWLVQEHGLAAVALAGRGEVYCRHWAGPFRLGGEILRLQAIMSAAGGLESAVMPVLRALVAETKETAALHVRRGSHRVRLFIVESPRPLREHVLMGEELPLDRGAGGLVLLAFSEKGKRIAAGYSQAGLRHFDRRPFTGAVRNRRARLRRTRRSCGRAYLDDAYASLEPLMAQGSGRKGGRADTGIGGRTAEVRQT